MDNTVNYDAKTNTGKLNWSGVFKFIFFRNQSDVVKVWNRIPLAHSLEMEIGENHCVMKIRVRKGMDGLNVFRKNLTNGKFDDGHWYTCLWNYTEEKNIMVATLRGIRLAGITFPDQDEDEYVFTFLVEAIEVNPENKQPLAHAIGELMTKINDGTIRYIGSLKETL